MGHGKSCDLIRRHRPRAENSIAAATGLPKAQVEVVRVRGWRFDLMHERLFLLLEEPVLLEGPDDRACELRHDAELR